MAVGATAARDNNDRPTTDAFADDNTIALCEAGNPVMRNGKMPRGLSPLYALEDRNAWAGRSHEDLFIDAGAKDLNHKER
jgi:hypothetical protein